jgi:Restriction endonuclease BglII
LERGVLLRRESRMKIAESYSHLNGLEFLQVHRPRLWPELNRLIARCHFPPDGGPAAAGESIKSTLRHSNWKQKTVACWVTIDPKLMRRTVERPPDEQKKAILAAKQEATRSFNRTDFVKDRVAVEVQFGKYFAVAYDLFVKHLAFYVGDVIDVGIEIVPMKSFAASTIRKSGKRARNMSTGVPWYEKELYNLIREGRGVPGVPLVIVGVEP